jgi:hypothetical protein
VRVSALQTRSLGVLAPPPGLLKRHLPKHVSWRGTPADNVVKDQATCGSCWVRDVDVDVGCGVVWCSLAAPSLNGPPALPPAAWLLPPPAPRPAPSGWAGVLRGGRDAGRLAPGDRRGAEPV